MKSNECMLQKGEEDIVKVLEEVEKVASYNKLSHKQTIQLRLLAEEMIGMQRGVLGFVKGKFYLENEGNTYKLHLHSDILVEDWTRERFVELSTDKRNAAYSGVMGKIRLSIDSMMNCPENRIAYMEYGLNTPVLYSNLESNYDRTWVLSKYREQTEEGTEPWDELEKSIVANLADEVIVGSRTDYVDMMVVKEFKEEQ